MWTILQFIGFIFHILGIKKILKVIMGCIQSKSTPENKKKSNDLHQTPLNSNATEEQSRQLERNGRTSARIKNSLENNHADVERQSTEQCFNRKQDINKSAVNSIHFKTDIPRNKKRVNSTYFPSSTTEIDGNLALQRNLPKPIDVHPPAKINRQSSSSNVLIKNKKKSNSGEKIERYHGHSANNQYTNSNQIASYSQQKCTGYQYNNKPLLVKVKTQEVANRYGSSSKSLNNNNNFVNFTMQQDAFNLSRTTFSFNETSTVSPMKKNYISNKSLEDDAENKKWMPNQLNREKTIEVKDTCSAGILSSYLERIREKTDNMEATPETRFQNNFNRPKTAAELRSPNCKNNIFLEKNHVLIESEVSVNVLNERIEKSDSANIDFFSSTIPHKLYPEENKKIKSSTNHLKHGNMQTSDIISNIKEIPETEENHSPEDNYFKNKQQTEDDFNSECKNDISVKEVNIPIQRESNTILKNERNEKLALENIGCITSNQSHETYFYEKQNTESSINISKQQNIQTRDGVLTIEETPDIQEISSVQDNTNAMEPIKLNCSFHFNTENENRFRSEKEESDTNGNLMNEETKKFADFNGINNISHEQNSLENKLIYAKKLEDNEYSNNNKIKSSIISSTNSIFEDNEGVLIAKKLQNIREISGRDKIVSFENMKQIENLERNNLPYISHEQDKDACVMASTELLFSLGNEEKASEESKLNDLREHKESINHIQSNNKFTNTLKTVIHVPSEGTSEPKMSRNYDTNTHNTYNQDDKNVRSMAVTEFKAPDEIGKEIFEQSNFLNFKSDLQLSNNRSEFNNKLNSSNEMKSYENHTKNINNLKQYLHESRKDIQTITTKVQIFNQDNEAAEYQEPILTDTIDNTESVNYSQNDNQFTDTLKTDIHINSKEISEAHIPRNYMINITDTYNEHDKNVKPSTAGEFQAPYETAEEVFEQSDLNLKNDQELSNHGSEFNNKLSSSKEMKSYQHDTEDLHLNNLQFTSHEQCKDVRVMQSEELISTRDNEQQNLVYLTDNKDSFNDTLSNNQFINSLKIDIHVDPEQEITKHQISRNSRQNTHDYNDQDKNVRTIKYGDEVFDETNSVKLKCNDQEFHNKLSSSNEIKKYENKPEVLTDKQKGTRECKQIENRNCISRNEIGDNRSLQAVTEKIIPAMEFEGINRYYHNKLSQNHEFEKQSEQQEVRPSIVNANESCSQAIHPTFHRRGTTENDAADNDNHTVVGEQNGKNDIQVQESNYFNQIEKIKEEASKYKNHIIEYREEPNSRKYHYIEESLVRIQIRLDKLNVDYSQSLRLKRKEVIKYINNLLKVLDLYTPK